jgi:tetratricopeptide (TPR) repeat protein
VNRNKYIVGAIGLVFGFAISFFLTQRINRDNPGAAVGVPGAPSMGGSGGQQAGMAQVQQTIEKAKADPNDFDAQVAAAKMFNQIGRVKETVEYLEKAYTASPERFNGLEAAAFVGQYYFEEKNYPQAEAWFNRAIKAEPGKADYYVALAETFVQRDPPQPDRAIDYIQQALKVDPKSGHAMGHLVEAYALKKDAKSAEDTLKRLKETDPSNDRLTKLQTMVDDLKSGKSVTIPKE